MLYIGFQQNYNFLDNFRLYLNLSEISNLFSNNNFLLMFWIHFVSINLFLGGWIVKDSQKFGMNKVMVSVPLIFT